MGQYANQPDFATRATGPITPATFPLTQADFLDSAALYVGGAAAGDLKVIMAGTVGPSTATELVSPGYAGSGGTGYVSDEYDVSGGSGTGMTVNITSVNGVVVSVDELTSEGTGYLNGDLVTIDATGSGNPGDDNAVFRVVAEPGLPTAAEAVVFKNIQTGSFVPVIVDYVVTGTTATDIVAVY